MRVDAFVAAMIGGMAFFLGSAGALPRAAADTWGACCLAHGSCLDGYDLTSCSNIGGTYEGDSTDCSSVTCEPVPCGESGAPVCGGTCPSGQRCTDTENLSVSIEVLILIAKEEGTTQPSCQCVEVLCGGAPLENGQGCCAGTPFTIGVQGCCNGEIVPVDSECICQDIVGASDPAEAVGLPIDLRDTGCCTLGANRRATDSSTEEGLNAEGFNIVEGGCCQRQFADGNLMQDPLVASQSTYTFGTGLDCCPGGPITSLPESEVTIPAALDLAGLCLGGCFEGECASQDCCQCGGSCEPDLQGLCFSAGSQSSCESFCATLTCDDTSYVPNAMCTEDGSCRPTAAEAPAASPAGLAALLVALVAIGGLAILARRRHVP